METPPSMRDDLGLWNNGRGIDLEGWLSGMGNYELAVGYATLFWPQFVEFEGYILREGFSLDSLRGFEAQPGITRSAVEWVMNHLHIADVHMHDDARLSEDKVIVLGNVLKEIYEAKLAARFPNASCVVDFHQPEPEGDIVEYQLSFWQKSNEDKAIR